MARVGEAERYLAFDVSEAARLARLSERQVRLWARDLVPAQWGPGLFGFVDLVALRTLSRLKGRGVSTQHLRRAGYYLKTHANRPWSELKVGVGPQSRVYFWDATDEIWLSADVAQQSITPIALDEVREELLREVETSRTRPSEKLGKIAALRDVCGSDDCFEGTRVAVSLVVERLAEGAKTKELLDEFPSLTRVDIGMARKLTSG